MNLDEAILHCKEKEDCTECGQEHRQLREWLEELRDYKNSFVYDPMKAIKGLNIGDTLYVASFVYADGNRRKKVYSHCFTEKLVGIHIEDSTGMDMVLRKTANNYLITRCEYTGKACHYNFNKIGTEIFFSRKALEEAYGHV